MESSRIVNFHLGSLCPYKQSQESQVEQLRPAIPMLLPDTTVSRICGLTRKGCLLLSPIERAQQKDIMDWPVLPYGSQMSLYKENCPISSLKYEVIRLNIQLYPEDAGRWYNLSLQGSTVCGETSASPCCLKFDISDLPCFKSPGLQVPLARIDKLQDFRTDQDIICNLRYRCIFSFN